MGAVFEMTGVWGIQVPHKARGTPHKKEKFKLGGPTFHRSTDVISLPLLHLLLRVRLLWFVCARTRRFWQNSTVFAELDGFRRTRHHSVGSLADSFGSLYCHSVNLC